MLQHIFHEIKTDVSRNNPNVQGFDLTSSTCFIFMSLENENILGGE
jgi:hypothetical protein